MKLTTFCNFLNSGQESFVALSWCQPVASEGVIWCQIASLFPDQALLWGTGVCREKSRGILYQLNPHISHTPRLTGGKVGRRKEMNLNSIRLERFVWIMSQESRMKMPFAKRKQNLNWAGEIELKHLYSKNFFKAVEQGQALEFGYGLQGFTTT